MLCTPTQINEVTFEADAESFIIEQTFWVLGAVFFARVSLIVFLSLSKLTELQILLLVIKLSNHCVCLHDLQWLWILQIYLINYCHMLWVKKRLICSYHITSNSEYLQQVSFLFHSFLSKKCSLFYLFLSVFSIFPVSASILLPYSSSCLFSSSPGYLILLFILFSLQCVNALAILNKN